MQTKFMGKYFFFGLLLATTVFTFILFRPFLMVLILGASFACVLYPIHKWLTNRKLPHWVSALLTVILFTIVLCGPLLSIGVIVFNQTQDVYQEVVKDGNAGVFVGKIENAVNKILPAGMSFNADKKISDLVYFVSNNIAKIFSATFSAFLSFLLMLLSIFYFLKDGAHFRRALVVLSPLPDQDDEKILTRLARAVNGVIKGYLLIALLQGILMWAGLLIFGVPNPALWGVVAAIASLIPTVGTSLVAVPAILFLLATGSTTSAIGLLIWALVVVGTVDNFLNPLVVSGKTNVPAFLILFSVLGGISLLGPIGILIGPLTVSLLYTLISIYRHEYKESTI
jgi:predicted PurR-regulated permease PerM